MPTATARLHLYRQAARFMSRLDAEAAGYRPSRRANGDRAAYLVDISQAQTYTHAITMPQGCSMEQASVFKSNKSQAVRLPKPVALPDSVKKVDIIPLGTARLIAPAGTVWDSWFDAQGVSDDFMQVRNQPISQVREGF